MTTTTAAGRADAGVALAEQHEGEFGMAVARQRIAHLAELGYDFTIDDARAGEMVATCSSGTWGAAFRVAARSGVIECVGYTTSTRPESHGRIVRTWRGRT